MTEATPLINEKDDKKHPSIARKLSFTTTGMMAGVMPEKVKLEYASVNLVVTFDEAPKIENVAEVVKSLFYYHRLSNVPTGQERTRNWRYQSNGVIEPRKMIRQLDIHCDSKEEWAEILQEQSHISLRREDLPWWEFVILNNRGKEDSLLLFRFDHCIGDGLAFAKVFTKMIRYMDGRVIESMIPKKMIDKKAKPNWLKMVLGLPKALFQVATSPNGKADDKTCFSKNFVGPEVVSYVSLFCHHDAIVQSETHQRLFFHLFSLIPITANFWYLILFL